MRFVVKNTTSWNLVDLLCPHTCRGCGRLGAILCERCKNDILDGHVEICPLCKRELDNADGRGCKDCETGFSRIFVGGWREGVLSKLVGEYKYQSVRAARNVLVEVMNRAIPQWWGEKEVVVVPLPTIGRHVRERGLDHTLGLARKLAKMRGWKVEKLLMRAADTVQVGARADVRRKQAEKAYEINGEIDKGRKYLLLDDVWTTGASALAALRVMKQAGAKDVAVVVIEAGKS